MRVRPYSGTVESSKMPRLSKQEETLAKARAEKFGRPYPNPIDVSTIVRRRGTDARGVRRG
jgi:hypothetical protein